MPLLIGGGGAGWPKKENWEKAGVLPRVIIQRMRAERGPECNRVLKPSVVLSHNPTRLLSSTCYWFWWNTRAHFDLRRPWRLLSVEEALRIFEMLWKEVTSVTDCFWIVCENKVFSDGFSRQQCRQKHWVNLSVGTTKMLDGKKDVKYRWACTREVLQNQTTGKSRKNGLYANTNKRIN